MIKKSSRRIRKKRQGEKKGSKSPAYKSFSIQWFAKFRDEFYSSIFWLYELGNTKDEIDIENMRSMGLSVVIKAHCCVC